MVSLGTRGRERAHEQYEQQVETGTQYSCRMVTVNVAFSGGEGHESLDGHIAVDNRISHEESSGGVARKGKLHQEQFN